MKISNFKKLEPKKVIVFDLDGTLTPTKAPMDPQMAALMTRLLAVKKVAVIGGGKYGIFKTQLLQQLKAPKSLLKNLFLFPATATSFYVYNSGWKNIYAMHLSRAEKDKIKKAFHDVFNKIGYVHPSKVYGKVIEDRGTQITFSALGQEVVAMLGKKQGVTLKEKWLQENRAVKMKMAHLLAHLLPDLEVHAAGFTSIDITRKGIDKAYGLEQIKKHLHVGIKDMLFVGDAIFPGGNDYQIVKTGVDYIPVSGPIKTKHIIRALLAQK
ncbi:MAG: HAD-IIB family hydrolase [Candidatus Sungbacteria bacterium]|nr:HAD-IIB family hydrolase [bacterium]MDZ4260158.1 HAD-IIB family hydrolase [Candidatus Sungbacteria bacterium]